MQTEEPYWLDESYTDSINLSDTGLLSRNIFQAKLTSLLAFLFYNKDGKYLDFAGGYGILTRYLRDIGLDCYWDDKFTINLLSKGFEANLEEQYELITSFEAFEHFLDPIKEIDFMLSKTHSILFSTEIFASTPPPPSTWDYYGFHHGQHISIYSLETLKYLSRKYYLNLYTDNNKYHLLTQKKFSQTSFKLAVRFAGKPFIHSLVRKLYKSRTYKDHLLLS